jgi:gliding motility-associated-like protein
MHMKKLISFLFVLVAIIRVNAQTTFVPGDIIVVGVNANTGGGTDQISFVSFKDITTGTVFDLTDNSYERVNAGQFGDNEGTLRITRTGATITAGTVFTIQFSSNLGITPDNNWDFTSLNGGSTFNMNANGDQLFIFQGGTWSNLGGTHDATYDGGVMIFAFNTRTTWAADGTTQQSNKFPFYECFHVNPTSASDWTKYNGPLTAADQRTWINRINNSANWQTFTSSANYNAGGINYIGGFTLNIVNGGYNEGTWIGNVSTNWFDCANWQSMIVPNNNTNVLIDDLSQRNAVVDFVAQFSDQYNDTARCNDLQINTRKVAVENTRNSIIKVHGNLTIGANGELDMSDGNNGTLDGQLFLYGNFNNTRNDETWFKEGGSLVHFVGNGNQIVNSEATIEPFYDVIIDKPNGAIILSQNIEIDKIGDMEGGVLVLKKGKVNANGKSLIVSNSSSNAIQEYSAQSYVYGGELRRNVVAGLNYVFPIGNEPFYELAELNLSNAISIEGTPDYISGIFTSPNNGNAPAGLVEDNVSFIELLDAGFWSFSTSGTLLGGTFDAKLYETGYTNGGANNYTIVNRANSAANWELIGQHDFFTEAGNVITVQRNDFNRFADFAIIRSGALPFAGINDNNFAVCAGSDTVITFTGTPNAQITLNINGTNQTFTFDNDGNLTVNSGVITQETVYVLTNVTSDVGVVVALTDTLVISITPLDNASFSYPSTVCISGDNPFATITGLSGGSFAVNNGTINTSTGEFDLSTASPNTSYTVTYTTNGSCPNSSEISFFVTDQPDASFAYAGPYCNDAGIIQINLSGGASVGVFSSNISGVALDTLTGAVNINTSTAGTYTITNTILASGGCDASTFSIELTIHPLPTILVADSEICLGNSVAFTASGANIYTWTGGIENGVAFTPTNAGQTTFAVEGTDNNGCKNTASVVLTVNNLDDASFQFATDILCKSLNNVNPTITGLAGGSFSSTNGLVFSNATSGIINLQTSTVGNYEITYSTNGNCPNSSSVSIEVANAPTANAGTDQLICGETIKLEAQSDTDFKTSWYNSANDFLSNDLTISLTVTQSTIFVFEAKNEKGCSAKDTVLITIENVKAAFTASVTEGLSPLAVEFTNSSENADTYSWNYGDASILATDKNPNHIYNAEGEYVVILTAIKGACTDTASLKIKVIGNSFVEVPNVFTPNGDNVNDEFEVKHSSIAEYSIAIYNRWGNKVFESNDIKNTWNGNNVSDGIYFYELYAKGNDNLEFKKNGWLQIIK